MMQHITKPATDLFGMIALMNLTADKFTQVTTNWRPCIERSLLWTFGCTSLPDWKSLQFFSKRQQQFTQFKKCTLCLSRVNSKRMSKTSPLICAESHCQKVFKYVRIIPSNFADIVRLRNVPGMIMITYEYLTALHMFDGRDGRVSREQTTP